jgi:hypothetical protein
MAGANDQGGGERSRREPAVASHRIRSLLPSRTCAPRQDASWRCRIAPARQRLQAHPSRTMHLAGPTIAERAVSRCHLGEHPMSPRHGRPRPLRHTPKGRWARAAPSALLGAVKCPLGAHKAATGRTGGRKSLSTKFVDFRPEKRSFPYLAISGTAWRGGRRAARARAGGMMAAPTILLDPPEDSDQIQNSVRIPNEIR